MEAAIRHLSQDSKLAGLIASVHLPVLEPDGDIYQDLLLSIVSQQLSGKAAMTIWNRFLQLFEGGYPHVDALLAMSPEMLRSAGLSGQKAGYLVNVAAFARENNLNETDWNAHSDAEIIALLTAIKGVGRWTAEMILMFSLQRPDVLPLDDLGIQQAMTELYGLEGSSGRQIKAQMESVAEAWRPYRTVACRYLWRWKDSRP